ncbi:putative caffeine resistance protein 5 [Russula emetica]|nr:putative caffeine resistance protein 5 [Russula emetica]
MPGVFQDTVFAAVVRAVLGPTYFPHIDEMDPPCVYQKTIHFPKSSSTSTTIGTALYNLEDPFNVDGHHGGDGVYVKQEISSRDSGDPESLGEASGEFKLSKRAKKEGTDSMLVTWHGPDDPENPMNWSRVKKCWVMFQLCFLTFSVYFGSAVYTAAVPGVAEHFHVSHVAATLGLTLFLLGCGIGPMLWSPLSEMPYLGRMPIYWGTLFLYVLLQIPTALSTNFGMLLAFRFITGFVGSPILATGGATIGDMYSPKKRVYGIALWGTFAVCAPATAPIAGGFVAHAESWRWTIWILMWLGSFTTTLLFFFFPETSSSNILYRRAKRLRKAMGDKRLKSQSEIEAESLTGRDIAIDVLVRPFTLNFQEPIVFILNLYIALIYALFYLWFESFPVVFIGIHHFRQQMLGLAFLGILCGVFVALPIYFSYIYHVEEKMYDENGQIKPEKRMRVAVFGSILAPVSLLWFGWTARSNIHWIVPILGSSLFPMSALLLFNVVLNYLADAYPKYAASVLAGNDFMRCAFAAAFPLFGTALYHNLGVGWASTLLALLLCAFIPMPIFLHFYGERIRFASKRAQHN